MSSGVVSTPFSTTVIAVDVIPSGMGAEHAAEFDKIITRLAGQFGSVSQDDGGINLALVLAPEAAVDPVALRLAAAFADFETIAAPARIRAVLNYGVVFRTQTPDGQACVGSAVRAARSALKRVPEGGGFFATREFAEFAAGSPTQGNNFELLGADEEGLRPLRIAERRSTSAGLPGSDPALVEFLKKRLAQDVGPFATPLVDNASHSTMTAKELIAALSHEIGSPGARKSFEIDALAYVDTRLAALRGRKSGATITPGAADKEPEKRGLLGRILKR